MLHAFETFATKTCAFCREWFCPQAYANVHCIDLVYRGIGKTKDGCVYSLV